MPEAQGILNAVYDPATRSLRVSSSGDVIWLNPSDLRSILGTPAIVETNVPGWALDGATTDEAVGASFVLPAGWGITTADIYWMNDGAGAGNVVWRGSLKTLTPGTDLVSEAAVATTAAPQAAAAQNVVVKTDSIIPNNNTTVDTLYHLRIDRLQSDAGDTLGNDVRLLGVRLRRAI